MKVFEKSVTYTQDTDTWQASGDMCQTLEVKTHRVDDGPDGSFITISTERWALDKADIDVFCDELKKILQGLD